jgi:hypothetical protein
MSSRCNHDFFLLALLLLAVDWSSGQGCRCDRGYDDSRDDPLFHEDRRQPTSPTHTSRPPIALGVGLFLVLIIALAWPRTTSTTAAQRPAESLELIEVDPPYIESAQLFSADVEIASVVEALPNAITSVPSGVEPLLTSRMFGQDAVLSLVEAQYGAESLRLVPLTFDVGSSRDDVIAAQGSRPTYSTKSGDRVWWGSSVVRFTPDGRVESWVQGTPKLMIRR